MTAVQDPKAREIQARLARPGAGLPLPAMLMLRLYMKPFIVRRSTWRANEEQFLKLNSKLMKELEGLTSEQLTARALVPPQRGLEDSSRYWSIAMTLRHLLIVGEKIEAGIISLSHGKALEEKVDTAKVKPEEELNDPNVVAEYAAFAEGVIDRIRARVGDKGSRLTHRHPWFGAMTAKEWLWLLGGHTSIHLTQIRAIKKIVSSKQVS